MESVNTHNQFKRATRYMRSRSQKSSFCMCCVLMYPGVAVILYLTIDESPLIPHIRAPTGFGVHKTSSGTSCPSSVSASTASDCFEIGDEPK